MKSVKRTRQENLAKTFDALGHYRRVNLFSHILSYGETGIKFGALSDLSDLKPATLAHHISKMRAGGIIYSKQVGNGTVFTANLTALRASFDTVLKVK